MSNLIETTQSGANMPTFCVYLASLMARMAAQVYSAHCELQNCAYGFIATLAASALHWLLR